LVAEEVEQVYPELVTYGIDGKIESVRYSMLTSMLLNELQKQSVSLHEQTQENERQAERIRSLSARLAATQRQVAALRAAFEERLATLEQAAPHNAHRNLSVALDR